MPAPAAAVLGRPGVPAASVSNEERIREEVEEIREELERTESGK
jgi:isopentenyl diphosphate isomerase/L-lactate dehydrogenase-like FMN-dependent dehydrogenase